MKSYEKLTPEGLRDLLFDQCRARRAVERRLSELFAGRGYRQVITPGLEYYDVFNLPGASVPQEEMYKSTDSAGRLLVFRPDSTLPIARMAAARLQGSRLPIRLYYDQSVYRCWPALSGRGHESAQMGVELLGAGGLRADLEVIGAAAEGLACLDRDFRIELGHAGLFQMLAGRLNISPELREEIRATIEMKNYGALGELLAPLGDSPAAEALRRLPRLFGGEEVLSEAERWLDGNAAGPLSYLKTLYSALKGLGLDGRLMVDLGLVQRNDYYSGVVFCGYVHDQAGPILTGGRYDGLCGRFGPEMPAAGFALDLDAAAQLVEPELAPNPPAGVLVHGEPGYETQALLRLRELSRGGISCEYSVWDSLEEAVAYAEVAGISRVISVGKTGHTIDIAGGKAR